MSMRLKELADSKLIEIHLTGKLVTKDYETFVPAVERLAKQHGKIDMLVTMHDFHGWTAGALWEDTKFAVQHFSDIERLAVVGETRSQEGMATFFKPFTAAKVRYFDASRATEARDWLASGELSAAQPGLGISSPAAVGGCP
jgi:hypothetical protein